MDSQQRSALISLAGAFPQAIPSEASLAVWAEYLVDTPGPILVDVVRQWILNEQHAPTIAAIRERAGLLEGKGAEAAWARVQRIVQSGRYRDRTQMGSPVLPPGFTDDPAMEAAVKEAGGWIALGRADEEQTVWAKKAFMAAYSQAKATDQSRLALNGGTPPKALARG